MTRGTSYRVRLAIASDRWFKRLINTLQAVHRGIWLGVLRPVDLAAANAEAYARWARFQDDSYNRSGLTDWEREAVLEHFSPQSRVLVPSAGGGREILGLEKLGHTVVGLDPSPRLVESGLRLLDEDGSEAQLILCPPDVVPGGLGGLFDAVLVGWGGYVHIQGRSTRVAFIRGLRSVVDEGAPMLLSFFLRSPGDRKFSATRRLATAIRRAIGSRSPIELGDTVSGTFDHYSTWGEIESEIEDGGFAVLVASSSPYPHLVCRAV